MDQPAPNVTRTDVERIVRRDFPPEQFEQVLAVLDEYGKERSQPEINRVQLDVLKLADGDMDELRIGIKTAKTDYRDVISWAEYPNCRWDTFKLPDEEKKKIYSKDLQQYRTWLEAK